MAALLRGSQEIPRNVGLTRTNRRDTLRSIDEIPEPYRSVFESYPCFNGVQSAVFDTIFYSDASAVVTAPTGSGKTTIFELAIVRLLMNCGEDKPKIVYMAPVKALCGERHRDWEAKLTPLGVRCSLLTGDTDIDGDVSDLAYVERCDVVVTTPEKWDFLTRRWRERLNLMRTIRLFLIDEVHLLNDESRGHVLEAVVSRMKMLQTANDRLRFIAVSATIVNAPDVAAWLGTTAQPALCYEFSEEMRPVRLNKVVRGYDMKAVGFRFDLNLSYKVDAILEEFSQGRPSLIFCSTRKSVLQTATILSQKVNFTLNPDQSSRLAKACEEILESKLRDLVRGGIGYHHAGMPQGDRVAVENAFRSGYLPVLIATSTLAMGVNLPAHLVVIKTTQYYNQGGYEEYSDNQILQMIGRAGRPQFDTFATAVIMTRSSSVARYERLVSGGEPVRSWLQRHLVEHLNAEIVLGSVRTLDDAVEWLKSTFFWVCAVRQPKKYGLPVNLPLEKLHDHLHDLVKRELEELAKHGLIVLTDDFGARKTVFGRIMARHYVSFDTMKLFLQMSGRESLADLLNLLPRCAEFKDITIRTHEKRALNTLNDSSFQGGLRFPLPGRIVNKQMKINCLLQATLGGRSLPDFSLLQDSLRVARLAQRLCKCLYEVAMEKQDNLKGLHSAAVLAKCVKRQIWEDSPLVARQLPRIGATLAGLLAAAGKTTLDAIVTSNPRDLERIINRLPPTGDEVQSAAAAVTRLQLELSCPDPNRLVIRVSRRTPAQRWISVRDDHRHWFALIVGDSKNKVFFKKRFAASDVGISSTDEEADTSLAALSFEVTLPDPLPSNVYGYLISEAWVGVDSKARIQLSDNRDTDDDIEDKMSCEVAAARTEDFGCHTTQTKRRKPTPKKTAKKSQAAASRTPARQPVKTTQANASSGLTDIRRFFPTVSDEQRAGSLSPTSRNKTTSNLSESIKSPTKPSYNSVTGTRIFDVKITSDINIGYEEFLDEYLAEKENTVNEPQKTETNKAQSPEVIDLTQTPPTRNEPATNISIQDTNWYSRYMGASADFAEFSKTPPESPCRATFNETTAASPTTDDLSVDDTFDMETESFNEYTQDVYTARVAKSPSLSQSQVEIGFEDLLEKCPEYANVSRDCDDQRYVTRQEESQALIRSQSRHFGCDLTNIPATVSQDKAPMTNGPFSQKQTEKGFCGDRPNILPVFADDEPVWLSGQTESPCQTKRPFDKKSDTLVHQNETKNDCFPFIDAKIVSADNYQKQDSPWGKQSLERGALQSNQPTNNYENDSWIGKEERFFQTFGLRAHNFITGTARNRAALTYHNTSPFHPGSVSTDLFTEMDESSPIRLKKSPKTADRRVDLIREDYPPNYITDEMDIAISASPETTVWENQDASQRIFATVLAESTSANQSSAPSSKGDTLSSSWGKEKTVNLKTSEIPMISSSYVKNLEFTKNASQHNALFEHFVSGVPNTTPRSSTSIPRYSNSNTIKPDFQSLRKNWSFDRSATPKKEDEKFLTGPCNITSKTIRLNDFQKTHKARIPARCASPQVGHLLATRATETPVRARNILNLPSKGLGEAMPSEARFKSLAASERTVGDEKETGPESLIGLQRSTYF